MRPAILAFAFVALSPLDPGGIAAGDAAVPSAGAKSRARAAGAPRFVGRYRFSGDTLIDGCGEQIRLYTGELEIRDDGRLLHAFPLSRDYPARLDGETLVASARFGDRSCPGRSFAETWTLRRDGDRLVGELATSWLRAPLCERPCNVVFRIEAVPIPRPAQK